MFFLSFFFRSVISLGSRPILSLSLSQPFSILKANQSECLFSLCVLWRFLPFLCCCVVCIIIIFLAVEVLLLFLFLACADKKSIGTTIKYIDRIKEVDEYKYLEVWLNRQGTGHNPIKHLL